MSRLGVSFADVAVAADELVEAGEQPTIEKIRDQLGKRGSFSTISKYLKEWRDGRPVTKSTVISPPDQVQAAVSAVWEKLHQETQITIEVTKAEAAQQVHQAQQEVEAASNTLAAIKIEHESLKAKHCELSAKKELLILDYKQAQIDQQLLRERLEAMELRHQEVKSLHEQQLNRLEAKYLAEIERLKTHAEQEVRLARQFTDTLKSHYEDARADSMRQIDQLKVESQKNYEAIKRLETDNASLKQALEAKTNMHQQITAQLNEAQKWIQIQQAQWNGLQDKRFVTEEIVAAFEKLPVQVAGDLQALLTEQVRIAVDMAEKMLRIKRKSVEMREDMRILPSPHIG